jgi:cytochrome c oxidase subunit II
MTAIIIILALVFLGVTIMVLSKTQNLMKNIGKKEEIVESDNAVDSANDFNGIMLFVFWLLGVVGVVWSFMATRENFLPEASSLHGKITDKWFWISMAVIMVGFFVINSVLFYFPMKYRYKEGRRATFFTHSNKLEVIWTIIPAIIMAGLVLTGLDVWTDITKKAPDNAEQIEIMGKQFNWLVRYGGPEKDSPLGKYNFKMTSTDNESGVDFTDVNAFDDFTPSGASDIYIPKGRPVLLKIRARDVLHSVFIPHMRVKMDAVPGMPTSFWFEADKTTSEMQADLNNPDFKYELACTEVCGRGHFSMKLNLIVLEEAEYNKWKKEQKPYLTNKPALMAMVPKELKAQAMKYLPVVESDSTTASLGGAGTTVILK